MDVDFDFDEVARLTVDLGHAGARTIKDAAVAIDVAARTCERDAKIFAPVDTGNLRNSITSDVRGLTAEIGPSAEYAAHVEFGTSRMAPQPYMGPAAGRAGELLMKAMQGIAARAVL